MNKVRAYFRVFILFLSLPIIVGWFILVAVFTGGNRRIAIHSRMRYARFILWVLNVKMHTKGTPPTEPVLLMANHRSWVDPILLYHMPMFAVAKAEIAKWPLIGYGSKLCGAVWVDRTSKDSRKEVLNKTREIWESGFSVLIFPEGTTYSLPATGEMRYGGFKLAADHNIPIVPVALEHQYEMDHWANDELLFIPHAIRSFGRARTEVKVSYGEKIQGTDFMELIEKTQTWIDGELAEMRKDWFIEK